MHTASESTLLALIGLYIMLFRIWRLKLPSLSRKLSEKMNVLASGHCRSKQLQTLINVLEKNWRNWKIETAARILEVWSDIISTYYVHVDCVFCAECRKPRWCHRWINTRMKCNGWSISRRREDVSTCASSTSPTPKGSAFTEVSHWIR